jgi:Predicted hydrolases or acyltransferases (alpha/beta hydrolase superfamily)
MINLLLKVTFLSICLGSCSLLPRIITPDYARETSLNYQSESTSFDSEFTTLLSNKGEKFNLLYHEDESEDQAILLLHGRGLYPNEPLVMNPLIEILNKEYNVYSIQLPVLKKNATYSEYVKLFSYSDSRIKKTLNYIETTSSKVIVIAHSCGAHMLSSFLKKYQNKIHKVILISAGAVDKDQTPLPYYDYSLFDGQILNILGDKDHNSVKHFAEYILSLNIKNLQNIIISDAGHYYKGKISSLATQVNKWLKLD